MKKVVLLGATGSIGESTLEILRQYPDKFKLIAIVANSNFKQLADIANEFAVANVCLVDGNYKSELQGLLNSESDVFADIESDVVISAIVGVAGLKPTIEACKNTSVLGLANKESIVCGGQIFLQTINDLGVKILPLDSEHNAIYQIFENDQIDKIASITLTASGGPFRNYTKEKLRSVTLKDALKHPNWAMGAKNTIDSATLMNKGLEVIEACYLFSLPESKVEVVVHPQSIIHGMVNYTDGSTLAHLSLPSMQVPISYALDFPHRLEIVHKKLDLATIGKLDFQAPDEEVFPLLRYAYDSFKEGASSLINLNMSNEVAVEAFIEGKISINPEFIEQLLESATAIKISNINDIVSYSVERKAAAQKLLKKKVAV
ncbi:UNVERIFIED_CONTAM: hypothetical protein GTU68_015850 [Idotea baltica]|nr:hypothetical protein [Idotea baltica]